MSMGEMLVLRLVHIVGGMFWVGSGLFNAFYLMPALREAGPAASAVMAGLGRRRMFVVLPTVALLTVLSGVRLMQITSGNFSAEWFRSGRGATFAWSGTAAIAAFIVGVFIVRPAGARAGALAQALQSARDDAARAQISAQLARMQRIVAIAFPITSVLLIIAAAGMAVARYVT